MQILLRLKNTNWRLVAVALCLIGILHIVATFVAPDLTAPRAYDRLVEALPRNAIQVLPPITPTNQPLPFMSADSRYAVCRFDTSGGPVALSATLPGPGWILALYSAAGDNFFSSVAQPGRRTDISLLLVPSEERVNGLTPDARQAAAGEDGKTLTVAAETGIAMLRAPDQGPAYAARNLAELERARCGSRRS